MNTFWRWWRVRFSGSFKDSLLVDAVRSLPNPATGAAIQAELERRGFDLSIGTIYTRLDRLELEERRVRSHWLRGDYENAPMRRGWSIPQ